MEKITKFLVTRQFPNYIFFILLIAVLSLTIAVIAVAVSGKSSSSSSNSSLISSLSSSSSSSSQESSGDSQQETEPSTAWEKYKKAEKYLYIWEYYTPDYIIKMCQDHHFTRVYLSIGCIATFWDDYYSKGQFPAKDEIGSLDYETFIRKLNEINVEVELVTFLDGDGNDFSNVERVDKVANLVKKLSEKVRIKALHFDQECSENFESLLKMYIRVNKIFPVSAILRPYWLRLKMENIKNQFSDKTFFDSFSDCETLVDALMEVAPYTDLMAYNQKYEIVEGYMEKLKTIASRHPNNEAKNIIEISGKSGVPEDDTLHQRYLEDKDKFFNFVYNMSKKYNGITIHYYEVWYETLYCIWPTINKQYDGGEPKNCN